MPATVSTPRARDVETARVEPPAASEASRFLPGRALTKTPNPPGREAILIELLTLLQNRSPSILRGPRRAGKTSILHAIKLRLGDGYKVRHITLEGTKLRTDDDLAQALEPELEDDARPAKTLRKRLRREPQPILLIDEIVHLREADPQAFAWLRAIGQGEVGVLLAGSAWDWTRVVDRANEAPGSSFGNDVTPIDLGPIGEHDARAFLVSGGVGDQAATWIVERCGGWPFYLQVLGHAVVQAVHSGQRQARVDKAAVDDLYVKRLLVERDNVFRSRWLGELPPEVRAVLIKMKDGQPPLYRELSRAERQAVRDVGFCETTGEWLDDRPFYDWISRNLDDLRGGA